MSVKLMKGLLILFLCFTHSETGPKMLATSYEKNDSFHSEYSRVQSVQGKYQSLYLITTERVEYLNDYCTHGFTGTCNL